MLTYTAWNSITSSWQISTADPVDIWCFLEMKISNKVIFSICKWVGFMPGERYVSSSGDGWQAMKLSVVSVGNGVFPSIMCSDYTILLSPLARQILKRGGKGWLVFPLLRGLCGWLIFISKHCDSYNFTCFFSFSLSIFTLMARLRLRLSYILYTSPLLFESFLPYLYSSSKQTRQ